MVRRRLRLMEETQADGNHANDKRGEHHAGQEFGSHTHAEQTGFSIQKDWLLAFMIEPYFCLSFLSRTI
jgi:hypothetical protein